MEDKIKRLVLNLSGLNDIEEPDDNMAMLISCIELAQEIKTENKW